jgi:hypothetical protein
VHASAAAKVLDDEGEDPEESVLMVVSQQDTNTPTKIKGTPVKMCFSWGPDSTVPPRSKVLQGYKFSYQDQRHSSQDVVCMGT